MRFHRFGGLHGKRRGGRRGHWRQPTEPGQLRLSDLQEGDKAVVEEIRGWDHFRIRLMEMGLQVGTTVEVEKYAPLQDPMEIIVKGYHLALRVWDAHKIIVRRPDETE